MEVGIKGLRIGNRADWDDFWKDGEEGDLVFCRKILGDFSNPDCRQWSRSHHVALH